MKKAPALPKLGSVEGIARAAACAEKILAAHKVERRSIANCSRDAMKGRLSGAVYGRARHGGIVGEIHVSEEMGDAFVYGPAMNGGLILYDRVADRDLVARVMELAA